MFPFQPAWATEGDVSSNVELRLVLWLQRVSLQSFVAGGGFSMSQSF